MKRVATGPDTISQDARVKTDIEMLDERLSALNIAEQEASRTLEVLRAEKRSLEARRAALDVHSQTRSIHALPPELLLEVFADLLLPERSAAVTRELLRRPVVISSVCKLWRELAFSTPALWSRIPVHNLKLRMLFAARSQQSRLHLVNLALNISPTQPTQASTRDLLSSTATRVHSMTWQISGLAPLKVFTHVVQNHLASFSSLRTLELDASPIHSHISTLLRHWDCAQCPALEELSLLSIVPSPKPDTVFSRLRILRIDSRVLRLSSLYALLASTPILETLVLTDTVPHIDVMFLKDDQGNLTWTSSSSRGFADVVALPRLTHIDWSFAPPWDARLLFVILGAPRLRSFSVCLNIAPVRWRAGCAEGDPLALLLSLPVSAPTLKELAVECVDTEALRQAFRKACLPSLVRLQITYLPPLNAPCVLPVLPRLESMFRDPRMLALTHLKLSHFNLDPEETKTMLRYMPVLADLTFLDCVGVGPAVCALSGGTCDTNHLNSNSLCICPRLAALRVVDSPDLGFGCLRGMVRSRYQCLTAPRAACTYVPTTPGRPPASPSLRLVKPLRRPLRGPSTPKSPATSSHPEVAPSSWDPYATTPAQPLKSICIEACPRICEVEAASLAEDFPPLYVQWDT